MYRWSGDLWWLAEGSGARERCNWDAAAASGSVKCSNRSVKKLFAQKSQVLSCV